MKYSKHSLNQKSNKKFILDWAYKEGVFQLDNGDYIARIKKHKGKGTYGTISRHKTKEEAEKAYNFACDNSKKSI